MSTTKPEDHEDEDNPSSSSLEGNNKSSKDILNELFSTFNTSFDDNGGDDSASSSSPKKKKKSSKKSKKKKDKEKEVKLNKDKEKEVKAAAKEKEKKNKKRKNDKEGGDDEDVDFAIRKHRDKVKSQFKGMIVSNLPDIVINNDELLRKNKNRNRGKEKEDVEEGEIVDDKKDKGKKRRSHSQGQDHHHHHHPHHKDKEEDNHVKSKSSMKLSASAAYKLDLMERELDKSSSGKSGKRGRSLSTSTHDTATKKMKKSSEEKVVRQAPPRLSPPPPPPRDPSGSDRRKYYTTMSWQRETRSPERERDRERDRRDRDGRDRDNHNRGRYDYKDVDRYYEREASRRSDGRSGFGFVTRSYYDEPLEKVDRARAYHHHHDDRRQRGRSRSPKSHRHNSRSPPPPHRRWRRSRSRSSERRRRYHHPDDIIDKAKLLEIARKNAAKLMRRGVLPTDIFSRDQIVALRAGGKSVEELTDYCRRLAKKDAKGDAMSEDDLSDGEEHFMHHPYMVKDKPLPQITLNIRNAIPLPVRTPHEMAIESAKLKTSFPVSSGTQHRIKELEWVPVDPDEEEKKKAAAEAASKAVVPLDGPKVNAVSPMPRDESKEKDSPPGASSEFDPMKALVPLETNKSVRNVDVGDAIAIRLKAMRQLAENPDSEDAKKQLEQATSLMKNWAHTKALQPKFLTQSELTQGPQAWAKRDQLTKAKEVQSPMGIHLLQKMGWRPGEGLGKNKAGDIEPLALEVKTDKKGLTSVYDFKKGPALPLVFDLSGKHPVSSLMELCAKRKWGQPDFDLVFEHGPSHSKQFVYKVIVNGVEYQPCIAVNSKKLAKANAAAFCLQSLGLLPTAPPAEPAESLQTVNAPTPVPPPSQTQVPPPPQGVPPPSQPQPSSSSPSLRFTKSAQMLQTVPSTPRANQPPLPPEILMPPPPPPPPGTSK